MFVYICTINNPKAARSRQSSLAQFNSPPSRQTAPGLTVSTERWQNARHSGVARARFRTRKIAGNG